MLHGDNSLEVKLPEASKPKLPLVSEVPWGAIGRIFAREPQGSSHYNGVVVMKLFTGEMARLNNGSTWDKKASNYYEIEVFPVGTKITLEVNQPTMYSTF